MEMAMEMGTEMVKRHHDQTRTGAVTQNTPEAMLGVRAQVQLGYLHHAGQGVSKVRKNIPCDGTCAESPQEHTLTARVCAATPKVGILTPCAKAHTQSRGTYTLAPNVCAKSGYLHLDRMRTPQVGENTPWQRSVCAAAGKSARTHPGVFDTPQVDKNTVGAFGDTPSRSKHSRGTAGVAADTKVGQNTVGAFAHKASRAKHTPGRMVSAQSEETPQW